MKWRLGAFASMIILMVFVLTACEKPNADYLRKRLAGDADFYALFYPHVGKDIDKYTITDVTVTYEHEENKGYMELSARITCTSEEAVFTGSFDIVLKKYGKGWDIDEMALNDYDFDVKVGPTETLIQSNWPVERWPRLI